MPAAFAKDLCLYRASNGKPNTSDANDRFSVELGEALFAALGVSPEARGGVPTGDPFSKHVAAQLSARGSTLVVEPERALNEFEQFRHVGTLREMRPEPSPGSQKAWAAVGKFVRRRLTRPQDLARFEDLAAAVDEATASETETRRVLLEEVGDESLLNLDVTTSRQRPGPKHPCLKSDSPSSGRFERIGLRIVGRRGQRWRHSVEAGCPTLQSSRWSPGPTC